MSKIGRRLIQMLKEDEWDKSTGTFLFTHKASGFQLWDTVNELKERYTPAHEMSQYLTLGVGPIEAWRIRRLLSAITKKDNLCREEETLKRTFPPVNVLPE